MDQNQFDVLTRIFTRGPSRRDVLRGLAAGLGLGTLRLVDAEAARNKDKKRGKGKKRKQNAPLAFNRFGCLDVGQPCKGNSTLCCSGICEGKKPKKGEKDQRVCAAHNAGFCTADRDTCTVGANVPCRPDCFCLRTTGNAGFCGGFSTPGVADCRVCTRDSDCQGEFGPGAACVVLDQACGALCPATGQTACMLPCL